MFIDSAIRGVRVLAKLAVLAFCVSLIIRPAWAQQSLTLTLETPQLSSQASTPQRTSTSANAAAPSQKPIEYKQVIGRVGMVSARSASIRTSRSGSSRILANCREGTPLGIVKQDDRWYGVLMIDGSIGWVPRALVRLLDYNLVAEPQSQSAGQRIVQIASKYLGVPYSWGGYSWDGLDCSGFVKAVFANFGIDLPRCSRDQAQVGAPVPFDQLQPGDRLYFACKGGDIDHTGIYAGNGYFIHSASTRGGVTFDSLDSARYSRWLVCARR